MRHELFQISALLQGTETFADPGNRTTGTGEAWFTIVGPGWSGKLPEQVVRYDASTNHIWLLGRKHTNGASDYDNVHSFQHGMHLVPLSEYPGNPQVRAPICVASRPMQSGAIISSIANLAVEGARKLKISP